MVQFESNGHMKIKNAGERNREQNVAGLRPQPIREHDSGGESAIADVPRLARRRGDSAGLLTRMPD